MKTPIFAYEPNDLTAFSTKEAAESYIEGIDVLNGEYTGIYDAEGYLLEAIVHDLYWIELKPVSPPKKCEKDLFDILFRYVIYIVVKEGQPTEWLEDVTLADLVAWVAENALTH